MNVVLLAACLVFQPRLYLNNTIKVPPSWVEIGKPLPSHNLEFGILLPQTNINILEDLVQNRTDPSSKNYGLWLPKKEIDILVSANLKHYNIIYDWLSNTIISYHCNNTADSLYCRTNVANINKLFDTEMCEYMNTITKTVFYSGRKKGYSIPIYMQSNIEMIIGIGDFPEYTHRNMKTKKVKDDIYYISPLSLKKLYNISNYKNNNLSSQSVVEFQNDQCFNKDDLTYFLSDNALKNLSILKKNIIGDCDMSTEDPDIEATLDIQYQLGVNAETIQYYVSVADWLYQFANVLYNLSDPPKVNSMSYGWAERDQCDPDGIPRMLYWWRSGSIC